MNPVENPRTGELHYLRKTVAPSLYRNGKVFTRRLADGADEPWVGADLEAHTLPIRDARALPSGDHLVLHRNGFERRVDPMGRGLPDFLDHEDVVRRYYPRCAGLVQDAIGADRVVAFDHNIRSASGSAQGLRIRGGQGIQQPISVVHGDYTLTSAPQRLRDLARPPTGNDTLASVLPDETALLRDDEVTQALDGGRFAIINVWRNISGEPVAVNPLALCDAATVDPGDLVVFEIHYANRIGENYFARHTDRHHWYFYPAATRDEALLIKQWDSDGGFASSAGKRADGDNPDAPCTFSFHSAFRDPGSPVDAPDRWSIEVRCVALFQ